MLLSLIVEKDL